jgi:hypothetical protein
MVIEIQVNRNLKGIELEKVGKVDQAIILYEMNINENFEGNHPYDRLTIIYRKRKLYDDEVRVLEKAIKVFDKVVSNGRQDGPPKLKRFKERLKKVRKLQKSTKSSRSENVDLNKISKCPYCGKKTPKNGNFCQECGKSIKTNLAKLKTDRKMGMFFVSFEAKKEENLKKGKSKYLFENNSLFAEELAIKYYENLGYNASWTENYYWWYLMALLLWEEIFAPINGVFNGFELYSRMNDMPMDFFKPEFYQKRKNLINNKIMQLKNADLEAEVSKSYNRNFGKCCRPIEDWNRYTLNELLIPTRVLNKNAFLGILTRLISNFNAKRSGLPDLIVYTDEELFFSEVKSERDRVSNNQREWHQFLAEKMKLKVDLFLINHSDRKIKNVKSSYTLLN